MSSSKCWLLAFIAVVHLNLLAEAVRARKSTYTPRSVSGVNFASNLHEVKVGHMIFIGGKSYPHARFLNMSFYGDTTQSIIFQIVLHWGNHSSSNEVVMNTRSNHFWGKEERASIVDKAGNLIVKPGEHFKIRIYILSKGVLVNVNDVDIIYYHHRSPISDIISFGIPYKNGLDQLTQFDHRAIYPEAIPIVQAPLCEFHHCSDEFSNDIPTRFIAGDVLIVTATPYGSENGQFTIEFTEGDTRRQALHFNARFRPEYVVVRNAMNAEFHFGVEERKGGFPFVIDHQFRLVIEFAETQFRFSVDGDYFATFKYRSENQLAILNGMKIYSKHGLQLLVTDLEYKHLSYTS